MMIALYVPSRSGVAAAEELSQVPWASLKHAYTGSVVKNPFTGVLMKRPDLDSYFAAVADTDEEGREEALSDLAGCLYHQGDLYEATAHAVPFLCALAAEPSGGTERELLALLVVIGEATAFAKNAAVAPHVLEAFRCSLVHVQRLAARPGLPTVRRFLLELAQGRPLAKVDMTELDAD